MSFSFPFVSFYSSHIYIPHLTGFYFKKNYFKNFISSQTQNTKIKMGTSGKGKKPEAPHNSPVEGKERKTTEENFQL